MDLAIRDACFAVIFFGAGAAFGVFAAAYAQNSLDARNVQAGAMIFDGKLYRITPEERP